MKVQFHAADRDEWRQGWRIVLGVAIGLATGFALDRFPAARVAATMTLVPALGVLILLLPEASFALAAAAVFMIGLQQGSEIDLLAWFVSRMFGFTHYKIGRAHV